MAPAAHAPPPAVHYAALNREPPTIPPRAAAALGENKIRLPLDSAHRRPHYASQQAVFAVQPVAFAAAQHQARNRSQYNDFVFSEEGEDDDVLPLSLPVHPQNHRSKKRKSSSKSDESVNKKTIDLEQEVIEIAD